MPLTLARGENGRRPSRARHVDVFAPLVAGLALATACSEPPKDAADDECQLATQQESSPGYPYDLKLFEASVLPVMKASCGAAGCHAAPAGQSGFTVWATAEPGSCDYAKTFNSLAGFVDLAQPRNSAVYSAISGGLAAHPVTFAAGDEPHDAILAYVEDASKRFIEGGGGGVTPPPGASPFDYAVFQSTIQPILDTAAGKGCAAVGCHGSAAGTFALVANPAASSPDMEANFIAVTSRMNLSTPENSIFYQRATTLHGAGASAVVSAEQAAAILAWIETAKQNAGDNPVSCVDAARFDGPVFRDEILPILRGDLDLNNRAAGVSIGCTRGVCHGSDRPPGSLILKTTDSPEVNLQNFACFVDLTSPSSSDVLRCPTDDPGCRKYPHPGDEVLTGADDLNYQRILSYLFAAKTDVAPLDFAFFARRISPILSDPNVSDPQAGGRSCSDTVACHGVAVAGQLPANGSNLGILPNASDRSRLTLNYVAVANFVNFFSAEESSLFLYPTNEIANLADHPLATGLPHPGGEAFAADSDIARDVLTWARGLRPDDQGFQRNWLVAGDFPATRIGDPTAVIEASVTPSILEPSGGRAFGGEWDGVFSDQRLVDLEAAVGGAAGTGRAVYAVAYLINTTGQAIDGQFTISSDNPVKVYVDSAAVVQTDGGQASFLAALPSFRADKKVVRILIKVLQRAADPDLAFTMQLRDDLGRILDDTSGVIVKLGPQGGI
jgi:hypothetical protein